MKAAVILAFVAQVSSLARPDSVLPARDMLDSLAAAEQRFFFYWGEAYRISEASRHEVGLVKLRMPSVAGAFRQSQLVCATSPIAAGSPLEARIGGRQIAQPGLNLGVCPSWFAGGVDAPDDERIAIDNALTDSLRKEARLRRQHLIGDFRLAERRLGANDWFVGQYVRLMIDQREFDAAVAASTRCRASRWWCTVLEAYALAAGGRLIEAERTFDAGLKQMPEAVQCDWSDHRTLLDDPKSAAEYGALTCTGRMLVNDTLWWLSDPLFSTPGNERKVEQFVRRTNVELRRSLDRDERFEWVENEGGAARRELVLRYGWPSYVWWGGYKWDSDLGCGCIYEGYTSRDRHIPNDIHTTYEYDVSHRHFIPEWPAIRSPFSAEPDSWTIMSPKNIRGRDAAFRGIGGSRKDFPGRPRNPVDSSLVDLHEWWPREHSASPLPLIQLPEGQLAFFRREHSALLASALELPEEDLAHSRGEKVAAVVTVMSAPDSLLSTTHVEGAVGGTLVSRVDVPAKPAVVGIELPSTKPAARTRFGIAPPPTLSQMSRTDRAISVPVLVEHFGERVQRLFANNALDGMLPTLSFTKGSKVAVVWETYGFASDDTVSISLWIERYTPTGFARRLGIALNIATDPNTPVVIQWQESRPGSLSYVIDGPVPIVGRGIDVDISGLIPGDYWIDVAVTARNTETVRSRRGFSIK